MSHLKSTIELNFAPTCTVMNKKLIISPTYTLIKKELNFAPTCTVMNKKLTISPTYTLIKKS